MIYRSQKAESVSELCCVSQKLIHSAQRKVGPQGSQGVQDSPSNAGETLVNVSSPRPPTNCRLCFSRLESEIHNLYKEFKKSKP